MSTYVYTTSVGHRREVNADAVTFEPGHVVFRRLVDGRYRIVKAERNDNVNLLVEKFETTGTIER